MYQEDMINEGDGYGGMPPHPKIRVQSSTSEPPMVVVGATSLEDVPDDEIIIDDTEAALPVPYNASEVKSDAVQRQYHEYLGSQPQLLPPDVGNAARPPDSPRAFQPSAKRSNSRSSQSSSPKNRAQEDYVLMPEQQNKKSKKRKWGRRRSSTDIDDADDDQYVANVALAIQFAMLFFCLLILVAVMMTVFSIQGYVVVVVVCLVLLVSLLVGLCTFVYQVLNEDDSPKVNSKHMPKWYKTMTKIIKDEIADFQEDWRNMYNGMYLLEDGDAGTGTVMNNEKGSSGTGATNDKSKKKRKGKSAVFKMIAKPAAVFVNFRRKRKEKKKQKKAEKAAAESYFPPFV